jgi:hypothetical protein
MARFRNTAITCNPGRLRTRLGSSPKVPSRRPCNPFAIPLPRRVLPSTDT